VADSKTVFAYIGIGCIVIVGVMAIAAGACGVWVYSEAQRFEAEARDPEARADRVLSILGADTLPEGYYPMIGISIPFVMETALLTDEEPQDDGEEANFGERGFIYLATTSKVAPTIRTCSETTASTSTSRKSSAAARWRRQVRS